jgi:1,4-dihydroxy-2-naphthoate octaprenyltransferase
MEEKLISNRRSLGESAGFIKATRAQVLPMMVLPVSLGAAYAWVVAGKFSWLWFGVTLVGAGAIHLAANVINDVFDIKSGADEIADELEDALRTGSPFATPSLATGLVIVAATCGLALTIFRGPFVLAFAIVGAALAFLYSAPPVAIGYRGRGLGEVAILLAFGPIPVAGSFYVQTATSAIASYSGPLSFELLGVPLFVWTVGLFPGLLTTLVLFHHHFLHYSADRLAGKKTPVAVWGPEVAILVSRPVLILSAVLLIGLVVLKIVPWWAVISLVPLALTWTAIHRAEQRRDLKGYLLLLRATAASTIASQAILLISVLIA